MAGDKPATGGAPVRAACLIATTQAWESTAFLPSLLAQAGVEVAALSPGLLRLSPFVTRHQRCSREPAQAAGELAAHLAQHRYDWVVVADEELLAAVSDRTGPRPAWFPAEVDPSAIVSKYRFLQRMSEHDVNAPASHFFENADAAASWLRATGGPLVVKGDRGFGGREVYITNEVPALRAAVATLAMRYGRALVQRFVRGDNVSVSVLYHHGEPLAWKASRTSCGYPDARSASTVHASIDHPDLERAVRAAGDVTGFHGFAGIDFVVDASNELFLLEFNPRPTLGLSGTRANRRFFEPAVRAFAGMLAVTPPHLDAPRPVQAFFPSYLLFALYHPSAAKPALVRSCIAEMRWCEWRLWSWLLLRAAKRVLGPPGGGATTLFLPGLQATPAMAPALSIPQRSHS